PDARAAGGAAVRLGGRAADGPLEKAAPVGPSVKYASVIFAVALVVFMAVVPPLIGGYLVQALTSYLISGLLALAVGLITGYGRLFNLGVGANFGVSAYTVAILTHFGVFNPFVLLAAALLVGLA